MTAPGTAGILALAQAVARAGAEGRLTPFALVFMLVSMGSVTALTAYVFYRILRGPVGYETREEEE